MKKSTLFKDDEFYKVETTNSILAFEAAMIFHLLMDNDAVSMPKVMYDRIQNWQKKSSPYLKDSGKCLGNVRRC